MCLYVRNAMLQDTTFASKLSRVSIVDQSTKSWNFRTSERIITKIIYQHISRFHVENMMCYPGMEDDLDLFQAFCLQSGFPQKFTADATQSLSITFRWEVCL